MYINAAKVLETICSWSLNMPPACMFSWLISRLFMHNTKADINPHPAGMITNSILGICTHVCVAALVTLLKNGKFVQGLKCGHSTRRVEWRKLSGHWPTSSGFASGMVTLGHLSQGRQDSWPRGKRLIQSSAQLELLTAERRGKEGGCWHLSAHSLMGGVKACPAPTSGRSVINPHLQLHQGRMSRQRRKHIL